MAWWCNETLGVTKVSTRARACRHAFTFTPCSYMSGTPRQRKPLSFEISDGYPMGAGTDTDQSEDAKLGAQVPLVSEVTRRYKVR